MSEIEPRPPQTPVGIITGAYIDIKLGEPEYIRSLLDEHAFHTLIDVDDPDQLPTPITSANLEISTDDTPILFASTHFAAEAIPPNKKHAGILNVSKISPNT